MKDTRVLKKHKEAVLTAISEADVGDADDLAVRVAAAVLTAYDDKMRWIIVTSDKVGFGPYATPDAAHKALALGVCGFALGTDAIVLPTMPAPTLKTKWGGTVRVPPPVEQLALF